MTTVPDRVARPNGWYGMLILLASESALFGTLIGTYVYLRFRTPAWPPPGVADPSVAAPLVLALVLAATSLPMAYAVRAGHAGRRQAALSAVALAFAVQAAYLVVQAHLYVDGIATLHPSANAYASIYFTLLAVHHLHVGAGLLLDVWILARLSTGLTRYRETALSAIALYWYVVGAIGLLVTATTLSPAW
jgi:heme/copper-type cytochrome/quinol oxidase subunit 3